MPRSMERRRRAKRPRWPERRTGFDRRRSYPVLGPLRESAVLLAAVLVAVNLLSLADGALTVWELERGIASEGNPVMAGLLAADPVLAAAFKIGITLTATLWVWTHRRYRAMLGAALAAIGIYLAVIAWHLGGIAGTVLV